MSGCSRPRRATRCVGCSSAAGSTRLRRPRQKRLARKKEQHESQAENRELEDLPGQAQPFSVAGQYPGEHGKAERDRDREADDALEARARLGAARELHAELRRALTRVELLAAIRGRLLADIAAAQPWRRGAAIRRAQRVEQLITSR